MPAADQSTGVTASPQPQRSRPVLRGCLFRLAALALGLLPLVIAEAALRALDLGRVTEIEDPYVGFSAIHPLFVLNSAQDRYTIDSSRLALFHPDSFAARKPAGEFRVFCLGGSTVQGSPYTIETSFTTWLELSLRAAEPERRWEVVNCGGLSYATYRLVPILQEVLRHEADLIVVYAGHNEFLEDRSYESVKRTPRVIAWLHNRLSHWRTYTACRQAWLSAIADRGAAAAGHRTTLSADVDAWLDYPGGLDAYHRDDVWRDAAVDHFEFNLARMARLTRAAHVPLVFCNPVSNLKDCPPFKMAGREDLQRDEREPFERLWQQAQDLAETRVTERIEVLEQASRLDDRHAGVHFLLGHCYLATGQTEQARSEFIRAKDEDICPLRILEPMHEALRSVAGRDNVPLVDVRLLYEQRTPDGIPGNEWLMDHVHPTINGHQLIADALLHQLAEMGIVELKKDWESRRQQAYHEHLGSLAAPYFARAKERLAGQRKWTEGRARKLFPAAKPAGASRMPDP